MDSVGTSSTRNRGKGKRPRGRNTRNRRSFTENIMDSPLSQLVELGMQLAFRKTRQQTKAKKPRQRKAKSPQNKKSSSSSVAKSILIDSDEDDNLSDFPTNSNISSTVKSRVDDFFKSSGLESDDEPNFDLNTVAGNSGIKNNLAMETEVDCTSESASKPFQQQDTAYVIDDDDSNDHMQSLEEIESYRKNTELMLKNATTLLDKFTGTEKVHEPSEPNSSKEPGNDDTGRLHDCPVCYEPLSSKPIATTPCGHLFCRECIERVAVQIKKCPTCRKTISKKKILTIFI